MHIINIYIIIITSFFNFLERVQCKFKVKQFHVNVSYIHFAQGFHLLKVVRLIRKWHFNRYDEDKNFVWQKC